MRVRGSARSLRKTSRIPPLVPGRSDLMEAGKNASQAIAEISAQAKFIEYRQVLAVDKKGSTAVHSGARALGIWTSAQDENVASGGNLLENDGVPQAIVDAFLASSGHLGDRLIAALRAGLAAGGEAGPVRSAGMKLVDAVSWPIADLRCDWTEDCPIEQVATAWTLYKPQMDAYIQRALDPRGAPSYGVPGNE